MKSVKERNMEAREKKVKEVREYRRWKASVKDHEND